MAVASDSLRRAFSAFNPASSDAAFGPAAATGRSSDVGATTGDNLAGLAAGGTTAASVGSAGPTVAASGGSFRLASWRASGGPADLPVGAAVTLRSFRAASGVRVAAGAGGAALLIVTVDAGWFSLCSCPAAACAASAAFVGRMYLRARRRCPNHVHAR